MKKAALYIVFLCFCVRISGQPQEPDIIHYVKDLKTYTLNVPTIDMTDYQVLDSADFHVIYRLHYRIHPDQDIKTTWVHLDVGTIFAKFYIDDYYRRDSLYTYKFKNLIPSYTCEKVPCEEILFNIEQHEMDVYNRAIGEFSTLSIYCEAIPDIPWDIMDDAAIEIANHSCFKAKGEYGGREWEVWFTPDLPVPFGPWKLGGLPGLILKAEDLRGDYKFELIKIYRPGKAIMRYGCKYHSMDKAVWQKYEKNLYRSPTAYIGNNVWFMHAGRRLDDTWSLPYNPIELE